MTSWQQKFAKSLFPLSSLFSVSDTNSSLFASWLCVMSGDHTNSYSHISQDMSDITRIVLWFNNWMLSGLHSATDTNWSGLHHIIMAPATSSMMRKLNSILGNGFLAALGNTQWPWQPYWTRNCSSGNVQLALSIIALDQIQIPKAVWGLGLECTLYFSRHTFLVPQDTC